MKEVVKKEILFSLQRAREILTTKEEKDYEELRKLSDRSIEDVAAHKDLDLVAITVLLYSLYKISDCLEEADYHNLVKSLQSATESLQQNNFGSYNAHIKKMFSLIKACHAKVKQHLQDVMQAARIKKGSILLQKGLSMGQAAGLMGLSNWDLQAYAGGTMVAEGRQERIPAKKRLSVALRLFAA